MNGKILKISFLVFLSIFLINGSLQSQTSDIKTQLDWAERLIHSIKTYDYGQSRESIKQFEDLVRQVEYADEFQSNIEPMLIDILKSDATLAAKQYICEFLSIHGTEASVLQLSKMLYRPETAQMALFALERITGSASTEVLIGELPDFDNDIKTGLINALGNRRELKSLDQIIPLTEVSNSEIASAAIAAIGEIGGEKAADQLSKLLSDSRGRMQDEILDAYLNCAEQYNDQGRREKAREIYKQIFDAGYSPPVRFAALKGLVNTSTGKSAQIVLSSLNSADQKNKQVAIQLLTEIPESHDISLILNDLNKFSEKEQVQLISALAGRKEKLTVDALQKSMQSESEDVQLAAIKSLAKSGNAGTVLILAQYAAEKKGILKRNAQESLYWINAAGIDQEIIKQIPNAEQAVKIELIRAVSSRIIENAVPVLIDELQSENKKVRIESIKAMKDVAQPDHIAQLADHFLEVKSGQERKEFEKTIVAVALKQENISASAELLLSRFASCNSVETKASILEMLGKIGDPAALPLLNENYSAENAKLRTSAIRGLSNWPDGTPIPELEMIAKNSTNDVERVLALRGYVRLIPFGHEDNDDEKLNKYKHALELAKNTNEKKMVIAGLTNIKNIKAMQLAMEFVKDPHVRAEAENAAMNIANRIGAEFSEQATPVMQQIYAESDNENTRTQAQKIIKNISLHEDHITIWQAAGPYRKANIDLFDFAFAPEKGGHENEVNWESLPKNLDPDNYWHVDLAAHFGGDYRVAYLRTNFYAEKEQEALLELGSDDGVKVWLNGELVHAKNIGRGVVPGDDKVTVKLKENLNRLLLKISTGSGGWGACARIRNQDGSKLDGLEFTLDE